jgi:hypothetical protein
VTCLPTVSDSATEPDRAHRRLPTSNIVQEACRSTVPVSLRWPKGRPPCVSSPPGVVTAGVDVPPPARGAGVLAPPGAGLVEAPAEFDKAGDDMAGDGTRGDGGADVVPAELHPAPSPTVSTVANAGPASDSRRRTRTPIRKTAPFDP